MLQMQFQDIIGLIMPSIFKKQQSALHEIALAIGIFVIICITGASIFTLRNSSTIPKATPQEITNLPLPTLNLSSSQQGNKLSARLVNTDENNERHYFSKTDTRDGFKALTGRRTQNDPERHNFFDSNNSNVSPQVALGDPIQSSSLSNGGKRFWIYEYSGNESQNQEDGKTGAQLFDGKFWLSKAQRDNSPQYIYLHNSSLTFSQNKRYYLMTEEDLCVSTVDSDSDKLNDQCEADLGTDPSSSDSDGGGTKDGQELLDGTDPDDSSDDIATQSSPSGPTIEYLGMVRMPTTTMEDEFKAIYSMRLAKRDDNSFFATLGYGVGILTLPDEAPEMDIEEAPLSEWTVKPTDIAGKDWADQYLSYIDIPARYNYIRLEGISEAHDGRLALNYSKYYAVASGKRQSLGFVDSNLDPSTFDGFYGSGQIVGSKVEGMIAKAPDGDYFRGAYWFQSQAYGPHITRITLPDQEEVVLSFSKDNRVEDWTASDWIRDGEVVEIDGRQVLLMALYKGTPPHWYGSPIADDPDFNGVHNLPGDPRIDLANPNKGYHAYPYKVMIVGYDIETWEKSVEFDLSEYMLLGDNQNVESLAFIGDTLWVAESRADKSANIYEHPHVFHAFRWTDALIEDPEDPANINHHPVLQAIPDKEVAETFTLSFTAQGSDEDNDTLEYSLISPPVGASIIKETGEFTWTPTEDQLGAHVVTIRVRDGGEFISYDDQKVNINVTDSNNTFSIEDYAAFSQDPFGQFFIEKIIRDQNKEVFDPTLPDSYFVSPNGSNSNDGSIDSPWLTMRHAVKNTGPGETVFLREGNYTDRNLEIRGDYNHGGSDEGWWVLTAYPGEEARVIDSKINLYSTNHVKVTGLHFIDSSLNSGGYTFGGLGGNHDIEFSNNKFTGEQAQFGNLNVIGDDILIENNTMIFSGGGGSLDHGIYLSQGNNNIVRGNYVSGAAGFGIHAYVRTFNDPEPHVITNALVEGNYATNSRLGTGFIAACGETSYVEGFTFRNNISYNNRSGGLNAVAYTGAGDAHLYNLDVMNNTFYEQIGDGITLGSSTHDGAAIQNVAMQDNVVYTENFGEKHMYINQDVINFSETNNTYWPGPERFYGITLDPTSTVADPNFVDVTGIDDLIYKYMSGDDSLAVQEAVDMVKSGGQSDDIVINTHFIGHGCTATYFVDKDCDGYGVGVRADGDYSADGVVGRLGDMSDADDNDANVNTPESVIARYGTIENFLINVKGHTPDDIYYIAADGNDANTGGASDPFATWERVDDIMGPGDVLIYREGTYYDPGIAALYSPFDGGTAENPVLFMPYPGERVVFDAVNSAFHTAEMPWATIDGFIIDNTRNRPWGYGMTLHEAQHVTIRNIEITNFNFVHGSQDHNDFLIEDSVFHDMYEHGLYLATRDLPSSNITIKDNIFYRNGRGGGYGAIQFNGRADNLIVENNIMHSNHQWAVSLKQGVSNSIIRNNLMFNNMGYSVIFSIYNGSCDYGGSICPYTQDNNIIENNTIWIGKYYLDGNIPTSNLPRGASAFAFHESVDGTHRQTGNIIRNNIISASQGPIVLFGNGASPDANTTLVENNIIHEQAGPVDFFKIDAQGYNVAEVQAFNSSVTGNVFEDPLHENVSIDYYATPESFDFDLSAGSPAIDFGLPANAPTTDLRGDSRTGNPDAGCYEY